MAKVHGGERKSELCLGTVLPSGPVVIYYNIFTVVPATRATYGWEEEVVGGAHAPSGVVTSHRARTERGRIVFSLSLLSCSVVDEIRLGPAIDTIDTFFFFFVSAQSVVSVVYIIRVSYVTKLILFYLG